MDGSLELGSRWEGVVRKVNNYVNVIPFSTFKQSSSSTYSYSPFHLPLLPLFLHALPLQPAPGKVQI